MTDEIISENDGVFHYLERSAKISGDIASGRQRRIDDWTCPVKTLDGWTA
jgi:hypothetical protein